MLLIEARKTDRSEDIAYARVYSINFPINKNEPRGGYKSFYSSEEAAEELIRKGKTDSKRKGSVARNIFAAAMACEGREDRETDRRWSAYKNDAGETILWDFVDSNELSPENKAIYDEQHYGASVTEEEDSNLAKKAKNALKDETDFEACKNVFRDLGFHFSTFDVPVSFMNSKRLSIPKEIDRALRILKFQREKNPDDLEKKKAYRYVRSIEILQNEGKLPREK